jgi:hypothetical protein
VLALGLAAAAWADPLLGTWRTAPDDNGDTGLIEVTVCGTSMCGTLVEAFDSAGSSMRRPISVAQIIWDTQPDRGWQQLPRPHLCADRDATYNSSLSFRAIRFGSAVGFLEFNAVAGTGRASTVGRRRVASGPPLQEIRDQAKARALAFSG